MIIGVVTLLKVKRVNGYDADDCMEWTQSKWQPLQCLTFASFVPCLYIHVCTVCVCMSSQSIRNHRIFLLKTFSVFVTVKRQRQPNEFLSRLVIDCPSIKTIFFISFTPPGHFTFQLLWFRSRCHVEVFSMPLMVWFHRFLFDLTFFDRSDKIVGDVKSLWMTASRRFKEASYFVWLISSRWIAVVQQ